MTDTIEDKEVILRWKYNLPCPTCGTPCNAIITTITQGNIGSATAEYTPVANTNT